MLVKCDNCGVSLLTEADLIVSQHRPSGDYVSCGCVEKKSVERAVIKKAMDMIAESDDGLSRFIIESRILLDE